MGVNIAFTPALGDAIQVPISDCCDELDTVAVRFSAVLGHHEYRQVMDGHFKVQVWSDIASPDVQGWRAYDFEAVSIQSAFQLQHEEASLASVIGNPGQLIQLAGTSSSSNTLGRTAPLNLSDGRQRLEASVPVSVRNARNFSFTYRITYSSGHIEWLGTYGHNGYAEVIRESLKGLNLSKDWSEAGRIFTLDGSNETPVTIAAFENVEGYDVWAFPRGLSSVNASSSASDDAELLLAIPREFGVYTRNPSYVIHASSGAIMHLDTSAGVGSLRAYGSGNIMVHACYDLSRLQSMLHLRPLRSGGRVELKVLRKEDGSAHCLIVSSSSPSHGGAPVKVVLIPIAQVLDEVTVRVELDALAQNLGDRVALVSGRTTEVRTLNAPFDGQVCTFVVPKHGGEFLLTPVHDFSNEQNATDVPQIAFLTPHSDVTQALEGPITLPTPPPSPHIPMLKKPQVSFAKEAELIPSTPPTPEQPAHPARELRKRRQGSTNSTTQPTSPSNSNESLYSDLYTDSDSSSEKQRGGEPARPTNLFMVLSFFAWARYLILLLKFVFGGGLGEWRRGNKNAKAIAPVPETQVLRDFSQEEQEESSATPDPSTLETSSQVSSTPAESDVEDAAQQEILAPKPSLPSQHALGSHGKALRVFYADLYLPAPSPFVASPNHEAGLIIIVQGQDQESINTTVPSLSKLRKVLTVNGELPSDLDVTFLESKDESVTRYLVRFSLPKTVEGAARLRIADTH